MNCDFDPVNKFSLLQFMRKMLLGIVWIAVPKEATEKICEYEFVFVE